MKCLKPVRFTTKGAAPCGQCLSCRLNKRRVWVHRMILESCLHDDSAFVTLTYDEKHCPPDGSLVPKHLQDFLKRLRHDRPTLRFFACGEYGDLGERPHYHLILFGFRHCDYVNSRYKTHVNCCPQCDAIRDKWGMGYVQVGTVSRESIQYVCGYVVKKMNKDHPDLNGRHPEFARQSNRPGIGAGFVPAIAEQVKAYSLDRRTGVYKDVPKELRHGKQILPLGRYLVGKLRVATGHNEKASLHQSLSWSDDMSAMFAIAKKNRRPLGDVYREILGSLEAKLESREKLGRKKVL